MAKLLGDNSVSRWGRMHKGDAQDAIQDQFHSPPDAGGKYPWDNKVIMGKVKGAW